MADLQREVEEQPVQSGPRVIVDCTHLGRRHSGIERITRELFSPDVLTPLKVEAAESSGSRAGMILHQMVLNPAAALRDPAVPWIFPGYPPSPLFSHWPDRTVLYVHDLFLMTRPQDLNWAAKLYMVQPFRLAISRLRYFLVNSATTARQLAPHVSDDAMLLLYRPRVADLFGLAARAGYRRNPGNAPLIVGSLGTIEPRKNFLAAARICRKLSRVLACPVEFHVIGRPGWGGDFSALSQMEHVRLHGFLDDRAAREIIESFDLFLCTSHDEGLGLPLLEVQYAGLPVVAPDQRVFWEVLGTSGTYVDPANEEEAATIIAAMLQDTESRMTAAAAARENIARWNAQADSDRQNVIGFLLDLCERLALEAGERIPAHAA
jgi:glycosyltransferase involved in cell wall biosynthesis